MGSSLRIAVLAGILAAGFLTLGAAPARAQGFYGYGPGYRHHYRYGGHGYGYRPYGVGRPVPFGGYGYYGPLRPAVRIYPYSPVPYTYGGVGVGSVVVPNAWGYPVAPAPLVGRYWW